MANDDKPTTTEDLLAPSPGDQNVTLPEPREPDDEPTVPDRKGQQQGGRSGGFRKLSQDFESFRNSGYRQHIDSAMGPLNEKIAALTALIQQQREQQSTQQTQTTSASSAAPSANEQGIVNEMNALVRELRKTTDDGRYQEITERYTALQGQLASSREKATFDRMSAEFEKKYGGQQQQQPGDPMIVRADAMIQDEFPELITGGQDEVTKALRKVKAYVEHETTVEERPRTLALYREAAAHIRAKLGKGEIPPPSRDRQTMQSTGGRGQGGGGNAPKNGKIVMPKALVRSALNAMGPGATPEMLAKYMAEQDD